MSVELTVNGVSRSVSIDPDAPLLYALRGELGLVGTRFGCGEGTCGACMVLIDGVPTNSCDVPVSVASSGAIVTVEDTTDPVMERVRRCLEVEQAGQCGYCLSGVVISATALIHTKPQPTREEVRAALDGNLCRCGTHWRMLRAIERAAAGEDPGVVSPPGPGLVDALDRRGLGNSHVWIQRDGSVVVTSGKVDIGQGISTAMASIAADELAVSVARIRILRTDTDVSPDEGITAGSFSVQQGGAALAEAAQELRGRLMALAAEDLGDAAGLEVVDGRVRAPSGETVTYWELIGGEDTLGEAHDAAGEFPLRWDLPRKLRGEPSFIHDIDLPGMLHGGLARPPGRDADLEEVDPARARSLPGVVTHVRSGRFLGVVSEGEYQAIRAARALSNGSLWREPTPAIDNPADPRYLLDLASETHEVSAGSEAGGDLGLSATFTRPFLAHGSIGPSCAIARWDDSGLTVWSHSQGVFRLREALADTFGLPLEQVRVIHAEGAGCYGHNGADDVALDAALLAREVPERPVRLQWSREDEFAWEPYGSTMVIRLEGSLDSRGRIVRWSHDVWSHPHTRRPGSAPGATLLAAEFMDPRLPEPHVKPLPMPPGGALRNGMPLYDVGDVRLIGHFIREAPVRTSALRGLGAQPNVFAIESFMEDLAEAAGADSVEFRLRHLSDPRARAVIETVVERAGVPVGRPGDDGHGFGLGFARYKNSGSYVAVIAEVEAETEVRVVRAWAAADAGRLISRDGAANQIEGGMVQSASWALKERIPFEAGRPAVKGWLDYPILGFAEVPELDVVMIDRREEPSLGVGEGAQGPMTAAIANGVRAALGAPVRDLPLTPDRVMKAILG